MEARFIHEEEEGDADQPIRYLPIGDLYSSTAPCRKPSASSNVMSKKVKASRKPVDAKEAPAAAATAARGDGKGKEIAVEGEGKGKGKEMILPRPNRKRNAEMPLQIYSRRDKKSRHISFFDSVIWPVSETNSTKDPLTLVDDEEAEVRIVAISAGNMKHRRKKLKNELLWLGGAKIGSVTASSDGSCRRLRGGEGRTRIDFSLTQKRRQRAQKDASSLSKDTKWVELEIEGTDPQAFVGLICKVYWPVDDVWYRGSITEYNSEKKKHDVKYDDGDTEHLTLLNEKIKFNISTEQMQSLNLKCLESNTGKKGIDYDELFSLAISFGAGQDREPGDVVWGKLTGLQQNAGEYARIYTIIAVTSTASSVSCMGSVMSRKHTFSSFMEDSLI